MSDYLPSPVRERFDRWVDETRLRYSPPLEFAEIRRGAQALSALYVERRGSGRVAERSVDGEGKRAAFASYFAPLHFLTVFHAFEAPPAGVRRIVDCGCGTGAVGAALALRFDPPPHLLALDRSGWALAETRLTARAFGLSVRTRRVRLPGALPRTGPDDLIALGWFANELEARDREVLLARIESALRSGTRLLVAEPLSERVSPWWPDWCERLAPLGARSELVRFDLERPSWIEALDRATRLDHRQPGARILIRV